MAHAGSIKECPVCTSDLVLPKILECGHLVCRQCILAILEAESENPARCPTCQHLIIPAQEQGCIDLGDFVDSLPTDFVIQFEIESQKVLSSGGTCDICENDSEAVSFCLQCNIKLCNWCSQHHCKNPFLSDHTVEPLDILTEKQLASRKSLPCSFHKEKSSEMYCSDHGKPVCYQCAASHHRKCERIEDIAAVAKTERENLEKLKQRLEQKQASLVVKIEKLNEEMTGAHAEFASMKDQVISAFMDLIKNCEDRKHKVLDAICDHEQAFMDEKVATREQMEALRLAISAHIVVIDTLMSSTSHMALLATLHNLKSRLDDLERKKELPDDSDKVRVGDVHINDETVNRLKEMTGTVGELKGMLNDPDKIQFVKCSDCRNGTERTDEVKTQEGHELVKCRGCDAVTEGTFRFMTQLLGRREFTGTPCIIRNIPWRIAVEGKPDGFHLGFYLWCDLPPNVTSCNVKATLKVLPVQPGVEAKQMDVNHCFQKKERAGVELYFNGTSIKPYWQNGQLTVEAHVVADAPEVTK